MLTELPECSRLVLQELCAPSPPGRAQISPRALNSLQWHGLAGEDLPAQLSRTPLSPGSSAGLWLDVQLDLQVVYPCVCCSSLRFVWSSPQKWSPPPLNIPLVGGTGAMEGFGKSLRFLDPEKSQLLTIPGYEHVCLACLSREISILQA